MLVLPHTHRHPFNGPFSGNTQVSRYQKGKTNLDFTEARDSEWQWHQLGHMQVSRQITMPAPHRSVFYRPDALPAAQPTASKHWRHNVSATSVPWTSNVCDSSISSKILNQYKASHNSLTNTQCCSPKHAVSNKQLSPPFLCHQANSLTDVTSKFRHFWFSTAMVTMNWTQPFFIHYHICDKRSIAPFMPPHDIATSGVTMGWLLRLVTRAPLVVGAPDSSRVLSD